MPARDDNVKVDLTPLQRFKAEIRRGLRSPNSAVRIGAMFKQWAARYLKFARRRFVKQSRGGGDWPPLKPATVARRRGGGRQAQGVRRAAGRSPMGAAGKAAILRDTNTLFGALAIGASDNWKFIRGGVRIGFLGRSPAKKRNRRGTAVPSRLTIAQLGAIHHFGRGHVPARPIIVRPDKQTLDGMRRDLRRAVGGAGRASERKR